MTLHERIVRYFEKRPGQEVCGAELCRLASHKTGHTEGTIERRLRYLAELSEWPESVLTDPDHITFRQLLKGGKVTRRRKGKLVYYTYHPPAFRHVRRVEVVDGKAREIIETIST